MWRLLFYVFAPIVIMFCSEISRAQETEQVGVNFAYAFQLGFGSYDIGGVKVRVVKLPISHTFDLPQYEKLKLRVNAPLYYGHFEFEGVTPSGLKITADQHIMSFIPGLELQYEVLDNWYLKPFGNVGIGWAIADKLRPVGIGTSDDSTIYIYTAGIRSLYEIFWERFKFSIGNAILWAGNTTFDPDAQDESYGALENGFEVLHPLGFKIKGYEPDASVFFVYYRFLPEAEFTRFLRDELKVKNQYEIAGTLGSATPLKLWIINDPRIGVGYRFGDLNVFTINFGFPF